MNKDELLILKTELLKGPLAPELQPLIAKGQDSDVAARMNTPGPIGEYQRVTEPPDNTPKESPSEVLFAGPITDADVADALRGTDVGGIDVLTVVVP